LFSLTHTVVLMLSYIYAVYYLNSIFHFYTNFGLQRNLYWAISQSNFPIAFNIQRMEFSIA